MNDGERVHIGRRRPKHLSEASVKPKQGPPRFYHSIRVAKRTVLKPGHTTLVPVTTLAAGLQVLIPKPSLMWDKRIQMANGVAHLRPSVIFHVEVTNFGKKNQVVPKNMVLGSVSGAPHSTLCIDVHDKENGSVETPYVKTAAADCKTKGGNDDGKKPGSVHPLRDITTVATGTVCDDPQPGTPPGAKEDIHSTSDAASADVGTDWRDQVRNQMDELDNPKLVPKIIEMLTKHSPMWNGELGEIAATHHRINLKPESVPKRQAPYRAGHKSRELITEQVEKMRKAGVIEPAQSEWASPVVLVTKKDGSPRFCVDYRKLNAVTIRDSYPIPRMDDCIDSLGNARVFTTLDCNSGYWQIPVAPEDKDKTAFVTHTGSWQFIRMPFGLTNAPATFQRALDILLAGVKWQFCLVYLDDVIIFSETEEKHISHVDNVLQILHQAGVTLKLKKSEFFRKSVDYLGHRLRPGKLAILDSGTEALREAQYPRNQTQLKSYLGSCNVYRRFVKNFAKVAAPLTDLLKKGLPFELEAPTQEQLDSFNRLRDALLNPPILRLPKPGIPYVLDVDASKAQLGCTLLQQQEDGILHPVGYWSRTMTDAQKNYTTTEKECLAVFWAITLLRPYLEGTRFTIRTDHNALTWILSITPSEGRLARWRLRLAEFDFDIQYRPGVKNLVPDSLSRIETTGVDTCVLDEEIPTFTVYDGFENPESEMYPDAWDIVPCYLSPDELVPEPITVEEWLHEQSLDSLCQNLQAEAESGKRTRFRMNEQGVLIREHPSNNNQQIVVPERLRPRVLMLHHHPVVAGHPGVRRMYDTLRQGYYWPTMIVEVFATVRACETCARDRAPLSRHTNPLKLFPAKRPLEDVAIDILGPLPKTSQGNLYILVMMDRYTKLCRLQALSNVRASTIARAFVEAWVFVYGPPRTLLSDNGKQFISKLFQDSCRVLGISNKYTTTYHPQANGQVERFNRTLASMLRNYVAEDQMHWDEYLPALSYAYNRCIHRATNTTPFDLILTRPPPALGTEKLVHEGHSRAWSRDQWNKTLKQAYNKANKSLNRMQARYKRDFDKSVSSPNRNLRAGDRVFVDFTESSHDETKLERSKSKLDYKTGGPYTVIANFGHTFDVEIDGIPERLSSDRVRPAPLTTTAVDNTSPDLRVAPQSVDRPLGDPSRQQGAPLAPLTSSVEDKSPPARGPEGQARNAKMYTGAPDRASNAQDSVGKVKATASTASAKPEVPNVQTSNVRSRPETPDPAGSAHEPFLSKARNASNATPEPEAPTAPTSNVDARSQAPGPRDASITPAREWVIDKLLTEGIDAGTRQRLFKVRWYNFGPDSDTWEPEDQLPAPLVAACRRRLKSKNTPLPEIISIDTGSDPANQKKIISKSRSVKNPTPQARVKSKLPQKKVRFQPKRAVRS